MGYEIDFLPVGEGGSSGDAIALRYGNLYGSRSEHVVVVIDGGFQQTGENLAQHIRTHYDTNIVDLVVSTHPDSDHINGLSVILDEMDVQRLWMHRPSRRRRKLERVAKAIENDDQRQAFEKSIQTAEDLESQAEDQDVPITEPFSGLCFDDCTLEVLSPSTDFYEQTVEQASEKASLLQRVTRKARETIKTVAESWFTETLTDDGDTTPNNNTSVVLLFSYSGTNNLFTSDVGRPALRQVADRLEEKNLSHGTLRWIQVPHHGSKRNVGPTVLDRILGEVEPEDSHIGSAYVSAAPDGEPKHPAKKVSNAFLRRGYPVHATQGNTIRRYRNAPDRGWSSLEALPLYEEVEE